MLILLVPMSNFAQRKWKVNAVPNTRLESNEIHISDPDSLISDDCEMRVNEALCSVQDKADVFVVVLGSIGDATPEKFASLLFDKWDIGDSITDNGVLLLLVKDSHKACFEVGNGAKDVMTEAVCGNVIRGSINPYFIKDDYENAICLGLAQVVDQFGGTLPEGFVNVQPIPTEPETKPETKPETESSTEISSESSTVDSSESSEGDFGPGFLYFVALNALFVFALIAYIKNRGKRTASEALVKGDVKDGKQQYYIDESSWSGNAWEGKGCFRAILVAGSLIIWIIVAMGVISNESSDSLSYAEVLLSFFLYLTWLCLRHNVKTLRFAKKLAKRATNPSSIYKAAYEYRLTKLTLWSAIWIGWIFLIIYKNKMKDENHR